jgi:hypothetical protein
MGSWLKAIRRKYQRNKGEILFPPQEVGCDHFER